MHNENAPQLILICGCNGSGKSTFTYSTLQKEQHLIYVDPDRIAKEENCSPMQAGRMALIRTKEFLANKESFLKESTLSSQSDLKLIKDAQLQGFSVKMTYLGLDSADDAVERVDRRYKNGGHSVPEEDIRRRYERTLENLPKAIALVDKIRIIDNSKNDYQHVATFEKGQLKEQNSSPKWFKQIEQDLGLTPQLQEEQTQAPQQKARKRSRMR